MGWLWNIIRLEGPRKRPQLAQPRQHLQYTNKRAARTVELATIARAGSRSQARSRQSTGAKTRAKANPRPHKGNERYALRGSTCGREPGHAQGWLGEPALQQ